MKLDKPAGVFAGLSIGDALGRPVEGLSRLEIQQRYGQVQDFLTSNPSGSDDTEYAVLTATVLIEAGLQATSDDFADGWIEKVCSQKASFLGAGFSEMLAIENLKRGLKPPASGKHIHCWSDGLAMRVAPIAIASKGDIECATRLAVADGSVSHSGEGIYSGVAAAVAATVAVGGGDSLAAFKAALESVPEDSWTRRALVSVWSSFQHHRFSGETDFALELLEQIPTHHYVFADFGPEAVALALASVLAGENDFVETLRFAVNLGRDADTIAAIAGSIVGGICGLSAIPENWQNAMAPLEGSCLEFTRGIDPMSLIERLDAL